MAQMIKIYPVDYKDLQNVMPNAMDSNVLLTQGVIGTMVLI